MASWVAWGVPLIVIGILLIIIIALFFFRKWMRGPMYRGISRMDGKVVVITGANTGIGYETALNLAHRGAKIIMLCRNMKKAQDAADRIKEATDASCEVYEMDLSSLASVRRCAHQLRQDEPMIHVLINNAGIMTCPEWMTVNGFEMQFGTNHLGHFLLTILLLDNIKAAAPSRIVTVSSLGHKNGVINFDNINLKNEYTKTKAYCQSKLANILFSVSLARRVIDHGVTTYSVHPGAVNTELTRHLVDQNSITYKILSNTIGHFLKTPVLGAQTSIYCAVDEQVEKETANYYNDCRPATPSVRARNKEDGERLWEMSLELVKQYLE